jgi:hypothetical protein
MTLALADVSVAKWEGKWVFRPFQQSNCSSLFFASQFDGHSYWIRPSPVLYPEDREDPSKLPFPSSKQFHIFRPFHFFSRFLLTKIEKEWDGERH